MVNITHHFALRILVSSQLFLYEDVLEYLPILVKNINDKARSEKTVSSPLKLIHE